MVCVRGVTRSPEVVSMWPLREGHDNMVSSVHKNTVHKNRLVQDGVVCMGWGVHCVYGSDVLFRQHK